MATAYQHLLDTRGLNNQSRQPSRWLHVSVERLNHYLDELTDRQLTALTAALGQHVAAIPAFTLQIGLALVSAPSDHSRCRARPAMAGSPLSSPPCRRRSARP